MATACARPRVRDIVPAFARDADLLLCRLAERRHRLLLPLARAAASLVAHSAWLACGCRNIEDYCRENFQRPSRWLRDLVRLQTATERLPGLASAVAGTDGGWPVGLCAALAVSRVATEADFESWIEHARARGLESLRHEVSRALRERGEAPSDTPDEEPHVVARVLLRLEVPPEVALAHEAMRDLHRAVAGCEAGLASFADALVGETVGLGWEGPEDFTPHFVPLGGPGGRVAGNWKVRRGREAPADDNPAPTGSVPIARPWRPRGATRGMRQAIRVLSEFDALEARQARLVRALERTTTVKRSRVHRIRRLTAVLRRLVLLENCLEIALAELLLELHEERGWRTLGFDCLESYAEERLGLGRTTARRRVGLARRLKRFPAVRLSYVMDRIGLEKAETLVRLLHDRPEAKQRPWIERAEGSTVKRLRYEGRLLRGDVLRGRAAVARSLTRRPGLQRCGAAPDAGSEQIDRFSPRLEPMDDATWRASLRRVPGKTCQELFGLGFDVVERVARGGPLLPVVLKLALPEDLAVELRRSMEAARRKLSDPPALTAAEEHQLEPSKRLANSFLGQGQRVPEWVGYLAVLEEVVSTWDDPRNTPERDRIVERDGYMCMAPGCTARKNLQRHHLVYRSEGGGDEEENILLTCAFHHLQGEHGGLARCRGRAPLDVVWRLGLVGMESWWRNEMRLDGPPPAHASPLAAPQ